MARNTNALGATTPRASYIVGTGFVRTQVVGKPPRHLKGDIVDATITVYHSSHTAYISRFAACYRAT